MWQHYIFAGNIRRVVKKTHLFVPEQNVRKNPGAEQKGENSGRSTWGVRLFGIIYMKELLFIITCHTIICQLVSANYKTFYQVAYIAFEALRQFLLQFPIPTHARKNHSDQIEYKW